MDTWRCPTCLCVLHESTAKRCPTCQTKLRKRRGQPIVLGETSRLDLQATLPPDRRNRMRLERGHWNTERPAPVPQTLRPAWIHLTHPEPEAAVAAAEPMPWFDAPDPEPPVHRLPPAEPTRRPLRLIAPPSNYRRRGDCI
jgi:hypothetical protein